MARREQAKAVRQMFADLRSWLSEQKARRQDGAGRVGRVTGRVTGNLTGRGPVASRG
jgi:hypothetical protein